VKMDAILSGLDESSLSAIFEICLIKSIKNRDIKLLSSIFQIKGFFIPDHDKLFQSIVSITNDASSNPDIPIFEFLLRNGLDLTKVTTIDDSHKQKIQQFILNDTLKIKINPNSKHGKDGAPFWRVLLVRDGKTNMAFVSYKGPNFSEPLDINATNNNGNTYIHVTYSNSMDFYNTFKPDYNIKNNAGKTPLESQRELKMDTSILEKYIQKTEESARITELKGLLASALSSAEEATKKASNLEAQNKELTDKLSAIKLTLS